MKYLSFSLTLIIALSVQLPVFGGMTPNGRQPEINPERNAYRREVDKKLNETREKKEKNKNELEKDLDKKREEKENEKSEVEKKLDAAPKKKDVFCRLAYDKALIDKNYIVYEENGIRLMMNLFSVGHTSRLVHLLVMPIPHFDHPDEYAVEEFDKLTNAVSRLYKIFNSEAYSSELALNWGKGASQSVPHWHYQIRYYIKQPVSLPDLIVENNKENFDLSAVFEYTKRKIKEKSSVDLIQLPAIKSMSDSNHAKNCECCSVGGATDDEKNLIIARFKHNYVCLSHYPNIPGEVSVVPFEHTSSIEYLSLEALRENLYIAKELLSGIRVYANDHIRDCDGAGIYIKGIGGRQSDEEKDKDHVHTVVMPRTVIKPPAGTIDGHSSYLPFDPEHLAEYLAKYLEERMKNIKEDLERGMAENQ